MKNSSYYAIGLMSGTSLDGLDIAYSEYKKVGTNWKFKIISGITIPYSKKWKERLGQAHRLSGLELMLLDSEYGRWIGDQCNSFIKKQQVKKLDLIASHGHTVFHNPQKHLTCQIGNGNAIHAITKIPVISDFRNLDIHNNGEGAPLVPIGDQLLFSQYDVCINLGGIANLSMQSKGKRIAYDICFANMGLNYLINSINKEFDNNGKLSSQGKTDSILLSKLNKQYSFYEGRPSLAREQFESDFIPTLVGSDITLADKLRTFSESIAEQIKMSLPRKAVLKILFTGGGTRNSFLMELITRKLDTCLITIPTKEIIDFKEALVFGFLGVLRLNNQINVLKSVTGANSDSSTGTLIEG